MSLGKQQIVSAVVIPRPARGTISGRTAITAENVADYAPAPEALSLAAGEFRKLGFEVTEPFGISFSITAPVGTFEQVFAARLEATDAGGVECVARSGARGLELPLDPLPQVLRSALHAVTFTPPPDFGPTDV